ncbi:MAG: hypothetical protein ABI579_06550, partial [Candidatus Sumerlaeota bacterium]
MPPADDDNIRRGERPIPHASYYDITNDFQGMIAQFDSAESEWLYQLFADRRRKHGKRTNSLISHARFHFSILSRLLTVIVMIGAANFFPLSAILLVAVGFAARIMVNKLKQSVMVLDKRLPYFVEDLCFRSRLHDQAVTDLFLASVSGREVAQAFLIETIQKARIFLRTTYAVLAVAIGLSLITVVGWQSYAGMLSALVCVFFALAVKDYIYLMALQGCCHAVEITIVNWRRENLVKPQSAFYLFVYGGILLIGFWSGPFFDRMGILLIVILLIICKGWLARRYLSLWQKLLDQCDVAFSSFVLGNLMRDDLGATWSKWYYGSGRHRTSESSVTILREEFVEGDSP